MTVRLEIGQRAEYSRVWLDGVEVTPFVRGAYLRARVGERSSLRLDLVPVEIEITGDAGEIFTRRFSITDPECAIAVSQIIDAGDEVRPGGMSEKVDGSQR